MKNLLLTLFTAALAVFPLASSQAALDSKIVSADARWLIHVDFNALRQSEIGRELIALAAKNHQADPNAPIHLDFQKVLATVGEATAYGTNFSEKPELIDGALVIQGTPELRKIAEGFVAQTMLSSPEELTEVKDLPFETYSFHGDVFVGFPKEQIILVSKMKAQLTRAYDLYRGKGASMARAATSPLRELAPAAPDSFLIAASVVPSEAMPKEAGPHARLLKMAQAASVTLGEKDKQTFANIRLIANSADTADKLQKIVQGLTAMASLANSNNNELEEFMKSVTVERQDLSVVLRLAYSSQRLSGMIQTMQQDRGRGSHDGQPVQAGKIVSEWKADQDLGSDQADQKTFTFHTVDKVHLTSGAIVRLSAKTDQGEHARVDFIEIQASDGSTPALKFEAEYMKLRGYRVETAATASAGKIIMANGRGVAELQFPGATGDYTIKVRYLDENDGQSSFVLRVEEPAAESDSE